MPSTVILGAPRWSGAPGLLPFRPAVLKYSTHAGQKRIAKSRIRYLVVTKSRRRRADQSADDHRESQPQVTVSQPVWRLLYVPEVTLRLRKGVQRETNFGRRAGPSRFSLLFVVFISSICPISPC